MALKNVENRKWFLPAYFPLCGGVPRLRFGHYKHLLEYKIDNVFTSWAKLRSLKIWVFFSFFSFFFVFCKNLGFFSNLQISVVLTTFLHIIDGLLLKYDMLIFFPRNLSGLRIFSGFFRFFFKSQDFFSFHPIFGFFQVFQTFWI